MACAVARILPDDIVNKEAELSWEPGGVLRFASIVRAVESAAPPSWEPLTRVDKAWRAYIKDVPSDKDALLPKGMLTPEVARRFAAWFLVHVRITATTAADSASKENAAPVARSQNKQEAQGSPETETLGKRARSKSSLDLESLEARPPRSPSKATEIQAFRKRLQHFQETLEAYELCTPNGPPFPTEEFTQHMKYLIFSTEPLVVARMAGAVNAFVRHFCPGAEGQIDWVAAFRPTRQVCAAVPVSGGGDLINL